MAKTPEDLPISRKSDESIGISQQVELRGKLRNLELEDLNKVLDEYQRLFQKDSCNEYKVFDAYLSFEIADPSYEEYFLKWIQDTTDSYQPYLAISNYYYAMGWNTRGHKWAKDTSEENFAAMRSYFAKAEQNAKAALDINSKLMVAYHILIGIQNANGSRKQENEIIKKALAIFPDSFLIRSASMWAKEPRWGGTYADMEEIANGTEKYWHIKPKLTALYGFIFCDQAKRFARKEKYQRAVDLLETAISYGDCSAFYYERAVVYHYNLKDFDLALQDINKCIELRPVIEDYYRLRSKIYFAKGNYPASIDDFYTAEKAKPKELKTEDWGGWASNNLLERGHNLFKTDTDATIEYYNWSIDFRGQNTETFYWRGMAYCRLEKNDLAFADFERAIEIKPGHFESYRMIDYILAKDKQWDRIINYWNNFIELEPDHAEAYLERSGTHYHNRDMKKAMDDLEKACKLGSSDACKRFNRLKENWL